MTRNVSIISADYALKIQPFVSTEQTRYYLNGFCLQSHPAEGALIVATTGHVMGIIHDAGARVAKSGEVIQLPKDFLKACKARSSSPLFVYIDHDAKKAFLAPQFDDAAGLPSDLSTLPLCSAVALNVVIQDAVFPDWRRVCPPAPDSEGTAFAHFNPTLLGCFAALSKSGSIGVYSKSASGPAWVTHSAMPEFMGILMPMRGDEFHCLPAWLNATPAAAPSTIAAE